MSVFQRMPADPLMHILLDGRPLDWYGLSATDGVLAIEAPDLAVAYQNAPGMAGSHDVTLDDPLGCAYPGLRRIALGVVTVGEDDERTRELLRLIAEGRAAARAAFLLKLETAKATREELAALFEGARVILADALCTLCGAPPAEPRDEQALRAVLGSRLTKAQILGTIELLETYRNHCEYNVGVGPLLGGLAVELEEIL